MERCKSVRAITPFKKYGTRSILHKDNKNNTGGKNSVNGRKRNVTVQSADHADGLSVANRINLNLNVSRVDKPIWENISQSTGRGEDDDRI